MQVVSDARRVCWLAHEPRWPVGPVSVSEAGAMIRAGGVACGGGGGGGGVPTATLSAPLLSVWISGWLVGV